MNDSGGTFIATGKRSEKDQPYEKSLDNGSHDPWK